MPTPNRLKKLSQTLSETTPTPETDSVMYVPDVVGHYMLVALPEKVEKKGNIFIPDAVAETERAATVIGHIIKQGPGCYVGVFPNGLERFPSGPWCKPGDYVVFGRYTGHRILIGGVEFRILADDQILATLDPGALKEISGL